MRNLHQDAGAVAGARVGADRAAVLEVQQNGQRVFDDLVRLASLDVGDEADAAGILVERGIVEAACGRHAGIGVIGNASGVIAAAPRYRSSAFDVHSADLCRVHLILAPFSGGPPSPAGTPHNPAAPTGGAPANDAPLS